MRQWFVDVFGPSEQFAAQLRAPAVVNDFSGLLTRFLMAFHDAKPAAQYLARKASLVRLPLDEPLHPVIDLFGFRTVDSLIRSFPGAERYVAHGKFRLLRFLRDYLTSALVFRARPARIVQMFDRPGVVLCLTVPSWAEGNPVVERYRTGLLDLAVKRAETVT